MGLGAGANSTRATRLARALAVFLGVLGLLAASASLALASTWTITKLSDDQVQGPLFGMACPSVSLCVAVGSDSLIATTTNPTGGRSAWKVVHPGGTEEIPIENEGGGGAVFPGAQIRGVSCPSTELCVGASLQGRFFSSTNPTGGSSAWKVVPLGGEKEAHIHMTGISCPSVSLCVAVAYGGKVISAADPTGDTSAWTVTELETPFDFRGVSCGSPSLCVAVDNTGSIVASADPTGGASTWKPVRAPTGRTPDGVESLNGISCPSPSLCVTGNAGQMITSTNPVSASSWNAVSAGSGLPVKGVSCPLISTCAAVDNNADAIVSTEPTGGSAAWSFKNVIPNSFSSEGGPNAMFGISCPSISLCAAAGQSEQIITSTDPFAPDAIKAPASRKSKRPRVVITAHPAKRVDRHKGGAKVSFRFHAIGKTTRLQCKISRHELRTCKSPKRYRLGKGTYAFKVRAMGPGGAKGPPATYRFRIGGTTERAPVGSCPTRGTGSGPMFRPCINAR
jgi:hypothetical protein